METWRGFSAVSALTIPYYKLLSTKRAFFHNMGEFIILSNQETEMVVALGKLVSKQNKMSHFGLGIKVFCFFRLGYFIIVKVYSKFVR